MAGKKSIPDSKIRDAMTDAERLQGGKLEAAKKHGMAYSTLRLREKELDPDTVKAKNKQSVTLVIPDLHCPFEHPDALAFLQAVKRRHAPTQFVCLGDEADFAAFSKYPKDPDGLTPGQELQRARENLIKFYLEFPEMMVCTSNHTVRPLKQMFMQGLPEAMYPSYAMLLNAPDGWVWKDQWEVDGVLFIHGEGRSGQNAHLQFLKAYKQSVVIGHIHSYAGVGYEGRHFAMNTGCLIDAKAYCFKYAKSMPIKVNLGCGLVVDGNAAYFIPMHLDENGRWTGVL